MSSPIRPGSGFGVPLNLRLAAHCVRIDDRDVIRADLEIHHDWPRSYDTGAYRVVASRWFGNSELSPLPADRDELIAQALTSFAEELGR